MQLFSLFRANPRLLGLIADLMGTAPRLASHLSRHVSLFEAMLARTSSSLCRTAPRSPASSNARCAGPATSRTCWTPHGAGRKRASFRSASTSFSACSTATRSGHLTDVAERVIQALLPRAEDWLSAQHGRVAGGTFMVLGLGKLGSRELTIGSDLDLIFVYDAPDDARSDGVRPLAAATYYARLGQRLVSALSAPTPEGRLYEIDTRLRPSGNLGPVPARSTTSSATSSRPRRPGSIRR